MILAGRLLIALTFITFFVAEISGCKRAEPNTGSSDQVDVAKRAETAFGIELPAGVTNVFFFEQRAMTYWAFLRFDLSAHDQITFLADTPDGMPSAETLKRNSDVINVMVTSGKKLPWWQVSQLIEPLASERSENKIIDSRPWHWTVRMCVASVDTNTQRVYLMRTEEAGSMP